MSELTALYKEYQLLCKKKSEIYFPDDYLSQIIKDEYKTRIIRETPLILTWDITNQCNLNCYFCSANSKNIHINTLNFEEQMKVCDQIIENKIPLVVIQGGEPFINKNLIKIIKKLTDNKVFTEVITNGTILPEVMKKDILELNKSFLRVKVSLDGSNPKINDEIRGHGSFYKSIDSVKWLVINNIYTRIQTVVTTQNIKDITSIYDLACKLKVNSFGFTPVLKVGRGKNLKNIPTFEELIRVAVDIKRKEVYEEGVPIHSIRLGYIQNIKEIDDLILSEKSKDDAEKIFYTHCTCAKSRIELDYDGNVYPCAFLRYKEFCAGNINKISLKELWKTDKWNYFRTINRSTKKFCNNCKRYWCCTGCSALGYQYNKILNIKDPNCYVMSEER